jgi:DnaJ family protein A protein 3
MLQMMMDLTFQEAARGANKEVNVNVKETCPKCRGSKAEPGTKASKCHHCNGTGMVRTTFFHITRLVWNI